VHPDQIPDPQSPDTFAASRLRWHERENGDHGGMLRLYRTLLHLRREAAPLCHVGSGSYDAWPLDEHTIAVRRSAPEGSTMVIVARLRGAGEVIVSRGVLETGEGRQADWKVVLTTEDQAFAPDPAPLTLRVSHDEARILFRRPSAVILARS
jgi:maltooligosyltrehalose trehalohydrolase